MRRWLPVMALVLLAGACAEVGRPPGGPVDDVAPVMAAVSPESLATSVDPGQPLEFSFSERLDRRRFTRSLLIVPDRPLDEVSFDGTTVRVKPAEGWPADTAVVWVLLPSLPDKHGVAMGEARTGAFTTGAALPSGRIAGTAHVDSLVRVGTDGPDWSTLRVRLTLDPEEGERQRRPWRFADGSKDGSFELSWLEPGSGPFRLEAWLDKNHDARRDAREPVATVDSLFAAAADSMLQIDPGLLRLIDLEGPVPVEFCLQEASVDSSRVVVWTWPWEASQPSKAAVDSTGCLLVDLVPGEVRWGAWLDLDGDRAWSRSEDGSSEPFVLADTLLVEAATPAFLDVARPAQALTWSEVDTMRVPPVPREAWSPSTF